MLYGGADIPCSPGRTHAAVEEKNEKEEGASSALPNEMSATCSDNKERRRGACSELEPGKGRKSVFSRCVNVCFFFFLFLFPTT